MNLGGETYYVSVKAHTCVCTDLESQICYIDSDQTMLLFLSKVKGTHIYTYFSKTKGQVGSKERHWNGIILLQQCFYFISMSHHQFKDTAAFFSI